MVSGPEVPDHNIQQHEGHELPITQTELTNGAPKGPTMSGGCSNPREKEGLPHSVIPSAYIRTPALGHGVHEEGKFKSNLGR